MTLSARVWLVFAVVAVALLLVGFIVMYQDLSSWAHDLRHLCVGDCHGGRD